MIRLFAALPLPDDIRADLTARQAAVAGARWRPRQAFHITLAFYGALAEPAAGELDAALERLVMPAFDVRLEGAGAFSDAAKVRALWTGVAAGEPLTRLATKCGTAARRLGLQDGPGRTRREARAYRPHVTLAYGGGGVDPRDAAAWVQAHNLLRSPAWRADRFGLYSSWPGPDGSRYELEREYRLH